MMEFDSQMSLVETYSPEKKEAVKYIRLNTLNTMSLVLKRTIECSCRSSVSGKNT